MIDRENMEDVVVLHPQKTREIIEKSQFIGNGVVGLINRVRETGVSSVFFLDKSARPLAWMFRKIWKGLANKGLIPEEENIPEIRFINIGRDQDQENFKPDSEAIRLAKEKYVLPPGGPILIVDEYSETAETLGRARDVVQEIFPDRELIEYTAYGSLLPWYGISEIIGVGGDLVSETGEKKGGK